MQIIAYSIDPRSIECLFSSLHQSDMAIDGVYFEMKLMTVNTSSHASHSHNTPKNAACIESNAVVVFIIDDVISAFKSRDDFSKVLGKTYLIININKKTRDLSVGRVCVCVHTSICSLCVQATIVTHH